MRKPMKRLFALALSVMLLVSQLGLTDGVAAQTEDPEATVQASVETPASEPVQDPAPEPAGEPEPVQPPVTETAVEPEAEAAEVPEVEATEVPEVEATEVPEVEATEVPEVEATEVPEVEATEVPEVEATEVPEVEAAEVPEVEATEVPEAEATEVPEVEATEVPEIEATEVPEVEATEVPEVEAAEVPEVEAAEEPEPEATEEPEPVVLLMSASATEPLTMISGDELMPLEAGGSVSLTAVPDPSPAVAGTPLTKITLTATDGTFVESPQVSNFSVEGAGVTNMNPTEVTPQDGGVLLTLSGCTPTQQGNLTVTVQKEAFVEDAQPDGDVTALISVSAADDPTVTASGTLTAGTAKGTIDLEITSGDNTFALNTPTLYTLECDNGDNLTVESVTLGAGSGDNTKATLTVKEAPTEKGSVTVKIDSTAFTYQPSGEVTASGTVTIKAATKPTISKAATTLVAGAEGGTITLTADANFAATPGTEPFKLSDETLTVTEVDTVSGTDTATLTISGTPKTPGEVITVTIKPEAFKYQPGEDVTATVTVGKPSGTIQAALEGGNLYAGTEVSNQKITLTIQEENRKGLSFKSGAGKDAFSLTGTGSAGLTIDTVSASGSTATLTLKGKPTSAGAVTVTAKTTAFDPESGKDIVAEGSITVAEAPTVSAISADPDTLTAGVSVESIKLTATGGTFATNPDKSLFTLSGVDGLTVSGVETSDSTATLTVSGTPKAKGTLNVTVGAAAFDPVAATPVPTASITVNAPTGTLEAALVGDPLYAGTEVNGQKITLTIKDGQGLTFKSDVAESNFSLSDTGMSVAGVQRDSESQVTLTLGGTPTEAVSVTVTANTSAFDIAPDTAPTATITVTAAPSVTLTAKPETTTTGVALGTVTLTASGSSFVSSTDTSKFQLSGGAMSGLSVTNVNASGTEATLTISGKPTTAGELTITVPKDAFNPVAAADATATITVEEVSGTVTASLSGTLTAGTEVTNQTITLTIASGKLTFKESDLAATDFQLGEGSKNLTIQSVDRTDATHVTLTLSGIPAAKGEFTVTAKTSAFAVPPTDNKDRTTEGTISIGYPKITLSATAKGDIYEDEEISEANNTITLTAEGGIFNTTDQTTYFTVTGVNGVTLASVSAAGDTNTATLTISGTPEGTGNLTITVQPAAFKYQPESALTNQDISVKTPDGSITVTLNGDLYKGTPVNGQTITVSIAEGSHGLVFKSEQQAGYFELTPDCGLTITDAKFDTASNTVTLTLKGTPTVEGQDAVTVTATDNAFEYPPVKTETGTITVNPAPTITLAVEPTTAVQGLEIKTITLTADGGTFADPASNKNFTVDNGLTLSTVEISDSGKTATLTVTGAPEETGKITVTVDPKAFVIRPESAPTAEIIVSALYGEISAKLNNGTLTAGTEVDGQTITLSITKTNGLTFKDGVAATDFQLGPGSEDLTITDVTRDNDTSVTLKLSGIPAAKGEFTVTALAAAFTVAPTEKDSLISTNKISIDYPTITLSVNPDTIYEGEAVDNIPITVTADGGVFDPDNIGVEKGNITISGHEELTLKSVEKGESDDTVVLHLSGTPSTIGTLIITIKPEAFTYQPEKALTATVTVSRPTGTVTAELTGEPLYAGTPVNGQTVILTIGASSHGLTFQPLDKLNINEFMLKQDAAAGLTIDGISRDSDTQVTLTLGGTPTTAGDFEVDAEESAFTYDPGMEEPAGTFTVNPAPVITVTADPASVTAGLELGAVTVTAEGGTFVAQPEPEMFTITSEDGIADNISVTAVKVEDDGTVTLAVTGAPTKDGTLLVTVDRTAFNIRPESSPQAKIAVTKLTGSVSMALAGGELTAGTAADGLTLELAASGAGLTFREGAEPDDFPLTGPGAEGLTVASVTRTDETHVTLTLSGTPAMAGELGVTVLVSAFAVPPTDGEDVTAAPSVTVAYPTITLAPTPATVNEGEALETITLTATGGVFNAIDGGTDGFAISGVEGVTLVSVTAADGSDTAILTLSGVPSATGTLTVTVQPEAFKYQPEKAVSAAISVVDPTGTVNAALSNALYADTPVTDQTITITIADSHGLSFKDGLGPDSFLLTGAAAAGLSISGVTGSGSAVTLTLSGTPAAGSFTVTVLAEAFTFDPGMDIDAGTVTVNAAPEVSLSAEPETLTAGEPVGTVTLTAVGGAFAAQPDTSLFALSGDAASGLSVSAVSVEGAVAVLTVTGAPEIAGTLTVTVDRTAFAPVAAASPTVDITVEAYGDGSLSTEVEVDPSAPGTQFGSSDAELADAVLTEEEQALLDAGAKVVITLQEDDISDSVSSTDKAAVEANADGFTVGAYLDVSLLKSINDHETPIHETNRPIRVVFSIPTDLRGVSGREFAVVRVHEGSGTVLQDLDGDPNTITVETDLFSTYAILYRDAPTEEPTDEPAEEPTDEPTDEPAEEPTDEPTDEPTEEPTEEPTDEPTEEPVEEPTEEPTDEPTEEPTPVSTEEPKPTEKPSATAAPTAPDTGDDEAPALWLALLTLGAGALVLVGGLLRRRSAQR